jgi:hypothetical protein
MLQPGKLLVSDDLTQPLSKDWLDGKGKWVIVDGVLRGSELASDMHGAVKRRPVAFDSAGSQYSFKLEGAKMTTLSINAVKGHLCRVRITSDGFSVQRDADKKKMEKPVVLYTCKVSINPNEWHTLVLELHDKEMIACLDGKYIAYGMHDGIAAPKANIGLTVAGESVSFKNFRVYEGTLLKTWEATKTKLLAGGKGKS